MPYKSNVLVSISCIYMCVCVCINRFYTYIYNIWYYLLLKDCKLLKDRSHTVLNSLFYPPLLSTGVCLHSCTNLTRRQWQPTLAWKIPWMEEPGRLQSMGSIGVGHD